MFDLAELDFKYPVQYLRCIVEFPLNHLYCRANRIIEPTLNQIHFRLCKIRQKTN